jgi:glyoxylase-like metal-dependent hydrolase (beta-lactamase superfamily II)
VPRSGLINLKHQEAKAEGLTDESEPIQIYFYELEHPKYGGFLIDSGVARSVAERRDDMPVKFPVTQVMSMDELVVHLDTKTYLEQRKTPLSGVFLTHLHLDHVLGLTDVPKDVPLYIGPGEAADGRLTHPLVRPTLAANLKGFGPLQEFSVWRAPGDELASVDIFGDGSLIGIHVPGHTEGNMAFLVRSTEGPQLLTGDSCHTAWGWEHDVEPGTFNTNGKEAAESLAALRAFAERHPEMPVHLGHQRLEESTEAREAWAHVR